MPLPAYKMVDRVLKIILLFSPLAFAARITPGKFEILLFHLSLLLIFLASLVDKPQRESGILSKGLAVFLLFGLINSAIHLFPAYSIATLYSLTLFCIFVDIVYRYMREPSSYYRYIKIAVIINIIVYLAQRYWFNFLPFTAYNLGGIFGSGQRFGIYLAVVTPICFSSLWFIIPIISTMTLSLNAFPIFLTMVLKEIYKKINWKNFESNLVQSAVFFLVFIATLGIITVLREKILTSILFRINSFIIPAIQGIFNSFLFGNGLGAYYNNVGNDPYNSLMMFTYDTGIFGLILALWGLWLIIKRLDWSIASLSLIGVILASMIDYPLEIARLWPTIAFILAAFFINKNRKEIAQCF